MSCLPPPQSHDSLSVSSKAPAGKVVVSKELYELISTVTEMNFVTSYSELLTALSRYVFVKKLYDQNNPIKIRCKADALGLLFGVDEFIIPEVGKFLQKLVFPFYDKKEKKRAAYDTASNDDPKVVSKRKLEESDKDDKEEREGGETHTVKKKIRKSAPTHSLLAPFYENQSDSALSDTSLSIQGYETARVADTSDDTCDDIFFIQDTRESRDEYHIHPGDLILSAETFDIEYDVSDSSSNFSEASSDSDDSVDLHTAILTFVCKTDSDTEFFADNSSDEIESPLSSDDLEISDADKWTCTCGCRNSPAIRFCVKCYNNRRGWTFSEPKTRSKRKRCRKRVRGTRTKEFCQERKKGGLCTSVLEASTSSEKNVKIFQEQTKIEDDKICLLCMDERINASIIHGKTCHRVTCFPCGKRLFKMQNKCPICRRTIQKVVREL